MKKKEETTDRCKMCQGKGVRRHAMKRMWITVDCNFCSGTGKIKKKDTK